MRIAIISACIFPKQVPRAHRATELAKFFAKQGHDVFLYASLGEYNYSGFESQYGIKVCSLGHLRFCNLNSDGYTRDTLFDRIMKRLFGWLLEYPDIELAWKVKRVVAQMRGVDLLVTVAMPHPVHWGAALGRKKYPESFPKIWVSDCGDPYMGNSVGKKHPSYFRRVEEFWGRMTDYITIPIDEARKAYSESVQEKIRVIPQGFDFSEIRLAVPFRENKIVSFAFAGAVYPGYRDPSKMLDYLSSLRDKDFRFIVYTKAEGLFSPYQSLLGDKLIIKDYVPREQLIFELSQMDFLVNILNGSSVQAPSKLIDYALTGRPIIDISSSFDERVTFDEFLDRDYHNRQSPIDLSVYDINNVGRQFLNLFS